MSDLVAAETYPIRPILRKGESLGGWGWRICPANGHDVPRAVRSALLAIRTTRVLEPDNVLSQLIGFERLKPLHDREFGIIDPWSKQLAPKWYAWSKRPRFCALCMAESECHLLYWDLPLVSACAVHGCKLITKCYACKWMWSWATLKRGWQCRCGAKVGEIQAQDAPLFAVRLSRILCAASDALVPQAVKLASCGSAPISATYQTRDVYEVLGWLLKARRVLTDAQHNSTSINWPMVLRGRSRMVPGSWEMSLLMGFPHTINRKARQTLRWFFRDSRSTLVDLDSIARWHSMKKLMGEICAKRNPMARPIFSAIERLQCEHHAGILGQENALFNPRLSDDQRSDLVHELIAWLRLHSANQSMVGRVSARPNPRTNLEIARWNAVFDMAHRGVPPIDVRKMARTGSEGAEHAP
ncbi:TniQ family protein [Hydrogenophaga sp. PAMC20947]|uniref:TniQ family protein n=1 Tax=Hydrogenophaga sp. PAMC20947 TaxID=2565558 RepID=UPI00109DA8A8|nr:TniQ family protein [Hydrogenophaga sp. PAMC20947]QCB47669.1 hypothetical protein E5678_17520 [Hydrogenophaga sp. PAMC20947]